MKLLESFFENKNNINDIRDRFEDHDQTWNTNQILISYQPIYNNYNIHAIFTGTLRLSLLFKSTLSISIKKNKFENWTHFDIYEKWPNYPYEWCLESTLIQELKD